MSADHYVFRSTWRIDADPDQVYAALADVASYPSWWPQVHAATQLDEVSGELRCRSMLPYDLVFVIRSDVEDREHRILSATLDGDLTGTSQWQITSNGAGSVAVFDEDVVVRKSLIRLAGVMARPALRYNHDRMMRAGERGLRQHLSRRPALE
ncbi:MAG: polyketide cyclase [Pseudonocardiales bacterium]|nr:MAG: polyketide cyclase [Pseudonocardiales bacterium]